MITVFRMGHWDFFNAKANGRDCLLGNCTLEGVQVCAK